MWPHVTPWWERWFHIEKGGNEEGILAHRTTILSTQVTWTLFIFINHLLLNLSTTQLQGFITSNVLYSRSTVGLVYSLWVPGNIRVLFWIE